MIIAIPKEIAKEEKRVAATPGTIKDYIKNGFVVHVEKEAGIASYISDEDYQKAGATIIDSPEELYKNAGLILKVQHPIENNKLNKHEVGMMKKGAVLVSFIQPTREEDVVKKLVAKEIVGFSMHLIPRITLAQKMDALSSQSNIAGYKAVLIGAAKIGKYMPLLMTAAGTISPAKVLVLGVGVAGLQAIATAKRLGASVEAFDVRPEVKEQVHSLGAKFIEVPANENDGVGEGGYARETSHAYKEKQMELIKEHIAKSDLVITTALIPGKPAPILITDDMVEAMSPGSIIVDLAAENGGNCSQTKVGKVVIKNQVSIDGTLNIPSTMSIDASKLYARNIAAFVGYICKDGAINLNIDDEIIASSLYTDNV